ncbi:MAG: GNAT family N-acetyltransferase [Pseudomonadota bacterium]
MTRDKHILLRPAAPDYEEGMAFARYMDQAADGFFRALLGKNIGPIMATAFLEPNHSLSYESVTFAVRDGKLIGMSSAYTGAQLRGFSDEPIERAAGRFNLRFLCMSVLFSPIMRVLNTVAEADLYLQGLAVDPTLRSSGVGSMLLADLEGRAQRIGASRLCLDVAARNERAQALYARRGMVECSRWPSIGMMRPVLIRMCKAVQSTA